MLARRPADIRPPLPWVLGWVLVAVDLSALALAGEQVITIAQYADLFISLDPQHTMDNASYSIQKSMLEGLIGFNEKMEQIPQLAERWDASPDAQLHTLHLRKGVKFHDGPPFNAAAVKAKLDRVRNPDNKLLRYTLYKIISQIDPLDDSTVRLTPVQPAKHSTLPPCPLACPLIRTSHNLRFPSERTASGLAGVRLPIVRSSRVHGLSP